MRRKMRFKIEVKAQRRYNDEKVEEVSSRTFSGVGLLTIFAPIQK